MKEQHQKLPADKESAMEVQYGQQGNNEVEVDQQQQNGAYEEENRNAEPENITTTRVNDEGEGTSANVNLSSASAKLATTGTSASVNLSSASAKLAATPPRPITILRKRGRKPKNANKRNGSKEEEATSHALAQVSLEEKDIYHFQKGGVFSHILGMMPMNKSQSSNSENSEKLMVLVCYTDDTSEFTPIDALCKDETGEQLLFDFLTDRIDIG